MLHPSQAKYHFLCVTLRPFCTQRQQPTPALGCHCPTALLPRWPIITTLTVASALPILPSSLHPSLLSCHHHPLLFLPLLPLSHCLLLFPPSSVLRPHPSTTPSTLLLKSFQQWTILCHVRKYLISLKTFLCVMTYVWVSDQSIIPMFCLKKLISQPWEVQNPPNLTQGTLTQYILRLVIFRPHLTPPICLKMPKCAKFCTFGESRFKHNPKVGVYREKF